MSTRLHINQQYHHHNKHREDREDRCHQIKHRHLREEANNLLYMQESDQITNDQSAFYYTKLHDFNSDGRLDGLELLLAVKHSLIHHNASYEFTPLEDMSNYVDSELSLMDLNNDGYVDYGEIYTYMQNNKQNNQDNQPKTQ
ncbi:unnamed protein product [Oppiella nova]|uniref:EF-hand domain-containing protein n=1 Tax=Oppiella nova TaxID=334625 RepID=A0A7R9QJT6_9ACAR|nr:unnamed protein product [Oppiella nova]CAG2166729.1 unnamed protein product [Oppiella nova]